MDIGTGTRVGVETAGGVFSFAVVIEVTERSVELELLEPMDIEPAADGPLTIYVSMTDRRRSWGATARNRSMGRRLSLHPFGPFVPTQKRRYARTQVRLPGQLRRVRQHRPITPAHVEVIDLSLAGASVRSDAHGRAGHRVILDISFPQRVSTVGQVVSAHPDLSGRWISHVAFDLPEEPTADLARIKRYLSANHRRPD